MEYIVIAALYVLSFGLFRLLGAIGGAADAFESWGRASASARSDRLSASS